jgi:hypothetical protein
MQRVSSIKLAYVLATFVLAQWAMTAALGLSATHNGWLFYHGGDGSYYWTTTWSMAHHSVPEAVISYGFPVLLWPLGLVFGANMLVALPGVIAFQVLVLAPLGVLAMYGLAARIGGRLFGYAAVFAWIVVPAFSLWYFDVGESSSRGKMHDLVLPSALGLTTLADYTSMILALVATYLVVRALDDRRWNDVVLAGLTTGTLIAVKPSNAYYLIAPLLAFAIRRRFREGLAFLALIAPALVTLAIWKKIGLGYVPIASPPARAVAYANGLVDSPWWVHRYVRFDWHTFTGNLDSLGDEGRSFWLVEGLTIAGMVGLIRRVPAYGIAISAWFASYLLFKGGSAGLSSVDSTSFYRLVMPAFPAFVVIILSVVFLVPRVPRRNKVVAIPTPPTRAALVAVLVLAVYPLALVATAQAWPPGRVVKSDPANLLVPVSNELRATAVVEPGAVKLSWNRPERGSSRVYYQVLRWPDAGCVERTSGARDCLLSPATVWYTKRAKFVDRWPPGSVATYRIGLLASWKGNLKTADLILIGPPTTVELGPASSG